MKDTGTAKRKRLGMVYTRNDIQQDLGEIRENNPSSIEYIIFF